MLIKPVVENLSGLTLVILNKPSLLPVFMKDVLFCQYFTVLSVQRLFFL